LYQRTIEQAEKYGTDKFYNRMVATFSQDRLNVCKDNTSIPVIEDIIGCGQVEELIQQAEEELELMDLMNNEFKPFQKDPEMERQMEETYNPIFGENQPGGAFTIVPAPKGFPELTFPVNYPEWAKYVKTHAEAEQAKAKAAAEKAVQDAAAAAPADKK